MTGRALSLAPNTRSLARADITEPLLDQTFRDQVIRSAVYQLRTIHCFDVDPVGHADCQKFWNTLADPELEFYCLGKAFVCVNCGATIGSLMITDGQELLRGRCPDCHEPVAELGLEQAHWWEMVAHQAGEIIATYDDKTQQVISGLIFRLARFLLRSGTISLQAGLKGHEQTQEAVYLRLLETFPNRNAWCSYASNWAVYGEIGLKALNIQGPLSTSAKCELMSAITQAAQRVLAGNAVPDASDLWAGPGDQRVRAKAIKQRLEHADDVDPTPSWERQALAEIVRIPGVRFQTAEAELPFILLKADYNQLIQLAGLVELAPLEVDPTIAQWLADTITAGMPVA